MQITTLVCQCAGKSIQKIPLYISSTETTASFMWPDGTTSVAPFKEQMVFSLHYGGCQQHLFSCSDTTWVDLAILHIFGYQMNISLFD